MASPAHGPQDTCPVCGALLSESMRHCPTCRSDAGAPNVRRCRTEENLNALIAGCEASRKQVAARGCSEEFNELESILKNKSGVVISMPAKVAMSLVEDPRTLYANYEKLVGAGVRKPADSGNDRCRFAVGGILFGSYADHIRYGALSLTQEGLQTYGDVHCRLRPVTIDKRTSFLETNSYRFIKDHGMAPGGKLPAGHMACWDHRHTLVLVKVAERLSPGQTEPEWQAILLRSDGKNREEDDFVEAHIYEGFDVNAIESMVPSTSNKLSRADTLDLDTAIATFKSLAERRKC